MKNRPYYVPRGLSSTGYSGGNPDEFDTFQNVETDHGGFEARGGMVRLAKVADARGILDFDGTNDRVDLAASWITMFPGTVWTIETLFQTDSIASDRFILGTFSGASGLKIKHTTTSTVVVTVTDTGPTDVSLTFTGIAAGTLCALKIRRNGTALTGWLNGTTVTGTMSALVFRNGAGSLGCDNGASWFDGGIDFIRGWSVDRSTTQDAYRRLQNPRHKDLVFDYVLNQGTASTPDVHDRGIYGYHAAVQGAPTWARTPLSNSAPIQGMAYTTRLNGTREVVFMSAGRPYTATVT